MDHPEWFGDWLGSYSVNLFLSSTRTNLLHLGLESWLGSVIYTYLYTTMHLLTHATLQCCIWQNAPSTLSITPYSPDLDPGYFFLFPKIKLALKGRKSEDIPEIRKNLTMLLKDIPQYSFSKTFNHLYGGSLCCIDKERMYVKD